ncbi:oxaloacetate decarboxylase [Sphingorhabdus sp. EL138]|uniref:isocitrate lyase/PEP mutase family protein n=1 Tax=Sphingorhabdus sp. EL138 TaxID=2073156 RepID=UPI000D68A0F7|nr:isocitrate lyase/PEP mutase family protein [Sphingorhabdus sp. EL138]
MQPDKPNLKNRLQQQDILLLPGIYDALSAVLAETEGLEAAFLSGSAVAFTQLGRPDVGLLTLTEMSAICARITDRVNLPIVVDVDSGFGNALHTSRTVREFERAGAAAIQIEDQIPIKPANALTTRTLISIDAMRDKIKTAVDARKKENMLVSARSDSPFVEDLSQTLERAAAYRDSGADIIFIEGLKTIEAVEKVVAVAEGLPVFYNLIQKDSEIQTIQQLSNIAVSGVILPTAVSLPVANTLRNCFKALVAEPNSNDSSRPMTLSDLNSVLGLPEMLEYYNDISA